MVTYTSIPGFGTQSQMDLYEFKDTLGYTRSMQKQIQMVMITPLIPVLRSHRPLIPALEGI